MGAVIMRAMNRIRPLGKSASGLSMLQGMTVALFILFAGIVLYPFFAQPHAPVGRPSYLSNVKQLGLGVLMYAQDFDDRFPPASQWEDVTKSYVKNNNLYKCRQSKSLYGYAFNKGLDRLPLKKVKDEKATVMIFEADAIYINVTGGKEMLVPEPRHGGKNVFGFVDGHATAMPKDSVVNWNP
jgi:prepilin-type processing-associated H-X9-DG protein